MVWLAKLFFEKAKKMQPLRWREELKVSNILKRICQASTLWYLTVAIVIFLISAYIFGTEQAQSQKFPKIDFFLFLLFHFCILLLMLYKTEWFVKKYRFPRPFSWSSIKTRTKVYLHFPLG